MPSDPESYIPNPLVVLKDTYDKMKEVGFLSSANAVSLIFSLTSPLSELSITSCRVLEFGNWAHPLFQVHGYGLPSGNVNTMETLCKCYVMLCTYCI